jgi:hypothetical protein
MAPSNWSSTITFSLAASLLLASVGCGNDQRPETVIRAETRLQDPDVRLQLEGSYAAPDSNHFFVKAFRRFLSGEVVSEERQAIVIGDRAWVETDEEWSAVPLDDPDGQVDMGSNPGSSEFWSSFLDTSALTGLEQFSERVNGINAKRVTTTDGDLVLQVLGGPGEEEPWASVEEFTVWLADDGGWPVAMRLVVLSEEYPFESGSEQQDSDEQARYDLPTEVLDDYRYASIIATERIPEGAAAQGYRTEWVVAISDVNAGGTSIQPPE